MYRRPSGRVIRAPMTESQPTTTLNVNGGDVQVAADPDTPLLYVLRNDLGLKGTLFGCGSGLCGACFVLIDDHATASCDTPLWAATGKRVITVEGLAPDGISDLQQAFIDEQAGQCGYCIAGILVSATAAVRRNPKASRQEILVALDRNLCRCGSHTRILDAVLRVVSG